MPGFPTAPAVQTVTDKLATIAPELGNVPGYYVYLKDPISGTIYESAVATDSGGNWSIAGVTMGLTYQYSYGKHPNTAYPWQGAYVASNPASGTATSPVQGVVTEWGDGRFNVKSPQNPSGAAKGDGVTDDGAAIDAARVAAAAVSGGFITFGAGVFITGTGIHVTTAAVGFVGVGWNSALKMKNGSNLPWLLLFDGSVGGTVRDLLLDGNQANNLTSGQGISTFNATDQLFFNVKVQNTRAESFYIANSSTQAARALLMACHITGSAHRSISLDKASNCLIQGCTVRQSAASSSLEQIYVSGAPGTRILGCYVADPGNALQGRMILVQSASDYSTVADNYLENFKDDGITLGNSNHCSVRGNTLLGAVGQVGPGISNWLTSKYNTIVGNTVTACSSGIVVDGSTGADTPSDGTIEANTVQGCLVNGISLDAAGTATYRRFSVKGNICQGNATFGIKLAGHGDACNVEGNILNGNGTNYSDTTSPAATANVVRNNPGFNPQGVAVVTPAASPWTYTAGYTPEVLYLVAGTVSLIVKNGITLGTGTSATVPVAIPLEPNEQVVTTYSVVPTANRDRK